MATNYVTCPRCTSQNSGLSTTCLRCGNALPYAPMPMQPLQGVAGNPSSYPGKLQAVSIIQTVIGALEILGGIAGIFYVIIVGIVTFGIGLLFIPIPLIVPAIGILSLIAGIKGLNKQPSFKLSYGVAISQIVLLLLCDFFSFGAGLAGVILLNQEDVKTFRALNGI